jgi:hypothetical protein
VAFHFRRREGGSKLGINMLGSNISKGRHRDLRQGEDLLEEGGQLFEGRGDVLSMRASAKGGQPVPEAKAYPIGDVGGGIAATSQPMTGLLGEQGLGPGGDGREAEAALREGRVKLLEGQPL